MAIKKYFTEEERKAVDSARVTAWRLAHQDLVRERGREYARARRAADPAKANATMRTWRRAHVARCRELGIPYGPRITSQKAPAGP